MSNLHPAVALLIAAPLSVGLPFLIWKALRIEKWVPLTVTQILAGLLLGPSILGAAVSADVYDAVFGEKQIAAINAVATVAVVLFGFLAGIGADRDVIRKSAGMTAVTGTVSMIGPVLISLPFAIWIATRFPTAAGAHAEPFVYALAFGLVMSITALPVLAAILVELGALKARVASVALAGAGVGNFFVWTGYAVVSALATMEAGGAGRALLIACGAVLIAAAFARLVAVPFLHWLPLGPRSDGMVLATAVVMAAVCAAVAQAGGLDVIFGAFLGGLFVPEKLRKPITDMLERPVLIILVPFFFLLAGLKTTFVAGDASLWIVLAIGLVVAILGKIATTAIAARACGESWAFGTVLGVLSQTKGLIAVVLTYQIFQKGVFGPGSYTALVIVALVCTALTVPLLRLVSAMSAGAAKVWSVEPAEPAPVPAAGPFGAEAQAPLVSR